VGLFTSLITLPLAPVRGTAWVAQQVAEEAERQLYDESNIRRELLQLELDHEAGVIEDEDYVQRSMSYSNAWRSRANAITPMRPRS